MAGKAGFGYADGDDATIIAIHNKHKSLYIRKAFELRSLPAEQKYALVKRTRCCRRVRWKEGNSQDHLWFSASRTLTGTLEMDGGITHTFTKIDVAGKSVIFEWQTEADKTTIAHRIEAAETERGKP